jgi:hypothetical protein
MVSVSSAYRSREKQEIIARDDLGKIWMDLRDMNTSWIIFAKYNYVCNIRYFLNMDTTLTASTRELTFF